MKALYEEKRRSNPSPAMMIGEEDIQELVREWGNVPEWVKSHLRAKYPAHRYEGEVTTDSDSLVFYGRDIKEGKDCELKIPFDSIEEVYLGFSNCLRSSIDLAFGMGGPAPLAVRYRDGDEEKTVYFNTGGDRYVPHVAVNNRLWCERLNDIIKRWRKMATGGRLLVAV